MRDGVIYPPASNDSKARMSYYGRRQYEAVAKRLMGPGLMNRHIDLNLKYSLYGKINHFGEVVTLNNQGTLAPLNANGSIFCVDFVADAFAEFVKSLERHSSKIGGLTIPGLELTATAVRGYESPVKKYNSHIDKVRGLFLNKFLFPKRNEIQTVNQMASEFLEFVKVHASILTITYGSFVLSTQCPHHTTGLSIDVMSKDYGDDSLKNELFLNEDYDLYTQLAAKSGFKVNINAPWNLIANLSSKTMQRHMSYYDISSGKDFLRQYFIQTYAQDFVKMKEMIIQMFYEFSRDNPVIVTNKYCKDGSIKNKQQTPRPTPSPLEQIGQEIDLEILVEIYLHCKYNENAVKIFQVQFDEMRDLALYEAHRRGPLASFKYLDKMFTNLNPKIILSKQESGLTSRPIDDTVQSESEAPAAPTTPAGTLNSGGSY
ncbi:hypothetical protein N9989_00295 [bacterium]|nr:hypothetical protein [bacterium]